MSLIADGAGREQGEPVPLSINTLSHLRCHLVTPRYANVVVVPCTFDLLHALQAARVRTWLIGGNAIELIVGQDIRPHDDIDLFVALHEAQNAVEVLVALGFERVHGSLETGDVFYKQGDFIIDLVPIDDSTNPPHTVGTLADITWPPGLLTPHVVSWHGLDVVTLSPEMHLRMKAVISASFKVEPRPKDLLDEQHLQKWLSVAAGATTPTA